MSSTVLQNVLRLLFITLIIFNCCHGAPRVKPQTDEKTSTNEFAGLSLKLWIIIGVSVLLALVVVCAIVVICCLCRGRRASQDNDKLSTAVQSSYYKSRQGPTDSMMDWPPPSTAGHGHGRGGRGGGGAITAMPSGMMSKMPTMKTKQPFSFRMLMPESLRSMGPSRPAPSTATMERGGAQTKLKTTTMLGGDQTKLKTTTMLGGGDQTKLKTTTMLGGGDQTKLKTTTMLGGGDQTKLKTTTVPSGGEHYTTW